MARAYLCPHCRERNRFAAEDAPDGVVRCGACQKAFLLPEAGPPKAAKDVDTAIVDSRTGEEAPGGGFEQRVTAIVDMRGAQDLQNVPTYVGTHEEMRNSGRRGRFGKEEGHVPGSELPTLMMSDPEPPRVSPVFERATVHGMEAQPAPVASELETVRGGDVPPAAALDVYEPAEPEPPRRGFSSADTQPTYPPEDYLEPEPEPEPPPRAAPPPPVVHRGLEASTTPGWTDVVKDGHKRSLAVAIALAAVLAAAILSAFSFAATRVQRRTEEREMGAARVQSIANAEAIRDAVMSEMLGGNPDAAHRAVRALSHAAGDLLVVRRDRTRAFVDDDWSTYARVLGHVCATSADERAPSKALRRMMGGGDTRLATLGDTPCDHVAGMDTEGHPAPEAGLPADLAQRFSPGGPTSSEWIDGEPGARKQIIVHAIWLMPPCGVCHGDSDKPRLGGLIVERHDLKSLDTSLGETRSLLLNWGAAVASLAALVVLALGFLVWRLRRPA